MRSQDIRDSAIQLMTGTSGRQRVEKSALAELKITAPDLDTQKAIAAILSSLDEKIDLNRAMNATLEATAAAIFKEWFVDFRYPDADGVLVEGLPKGWMWGKLGTDFNLTMGQSPPGESYNEAAIGTIFFQGKTDYGFRFPQNRIYTTAPNRIAQELDTLVSVRAPVGAINMAIEKCCIGRGLSAVRHKSGAHSYTYYAMKNIENSFKNFENEGTVFGSINKTNFENIVVIIPPRDIVAQYEKIVNPIDDKIMTNEQQTRTLRSLRDGLLPRLLRGEIEVPMG